MSELPIHYAELENIYSQTIDAGIRSLVITSCNPQEGVTTLACALAKRAQAGGRKTLLVDMNFFRPSIGTQLGLPLESWQEIDDRLCSKIIHSDSLSVLPAPEVPNRNLLLREKSYLQQCLDTWMEAFDVIIIDTSPINANNRNNLPAARISSVCEACLLVVLAGETRQGCVAGAVQRLEQQGATLLGCVYNDLNNPSLLDEMLRESYRLQRLFPGFMSWFRNKIRHSNLLNQSV